MVADAGAVFAPMIRKLEGSSVFGGADRDAILALPFTMSDVSSAAYLVRDGQRVDKCSLLVSGYA